MIPSNVDKHIDATYFRLRVGLALLAFFFPFVLLVVGRYVHNIPFQENMSAYYFAFDPMKSALRVFPMRDWFVGILWAIGCFLVLYRGFSTPENWVLNLAGLSALGVAMLPTSPPDYCTNCGDGWPVAHKVLAVVLFVCIAAVAWIFRWETVQLLREKRVRDWFGRVYGALAIAMVVSPLVAIVVSFGFAAYKSATIFIETFAICIFAVFWLVKTYEIHIIDTQPEARHADFQAAAGALTDEERGSLSMRLNRSLTRS
jgi:hypothetical protein